MAERLLTTPFTTALELSFTALEKQMVASGIYLIGTPLESLLALGRAHQLNLKLLLSEQALISSNKPRK